MGSFTPEALQEIAYSAYDEVLNRRSPEIYDRYNLVWLSFLRSRLNRVGGYGGKVIQKLQQKDGRSIKHYSHRDVREATEIRVDNEMEFNLRRSYDGLEILHEVIEEQGYEVMPNGLRAGKSPRSIARKTSVGELHRIMNIYEQKIEQWLDEFMVNFDLLMLQDGTQDPLAPIGLDGLMPLDPTSGTIGGKSRSDPQFQHIVYSGLTVGTGGTLADGMENGLRDANRFNRGTRSRIDFGMAGADFMQAYKSYRRANDARFNNDMDKVTKLDIAIPDDAVYHGGTPIIYNPAFDEMDNLGLGGATPWAKRCYMLSSQSWALAHTYDSLEVVSIPQDPPTQRFTRFFVENRVCLVPRKIRGNALFTIA